MKIMEKMTVHEALCFIKVADKRIGDAIDNCAFCASNKESSPKVNGVPVKEFEDDVKAKHQSIQDLIKRTEKIKAALSLSNAATKVTVCGKEMTVAEAIYMMQYGILTKMNLLRSMESKLRAAQLVITSENGHKLDERLDKYIQSVYGSKEKITPEELDKASKDFKARNEYKLVDPLKIADKIEALKKEIDEFQAAVDSAIQISNATTYIEIED